MNNSTKEKKVQNERIEARARLAKKLGIDFDFMFDKFVLAVFTSLPPNDPYKGEPR